MNRLTILITLAFSCIILSAASAQDKLTEALNKDSKRDTKTYKVKSLEGKNKTICIIPDYEKSVLKIRCLNDTIKINDFWGVPPFITVLGKTFLEVDYAIRGGSGVGLGNTLIFCIGHNHLQKCMYVMKYLNGDSAGEQDDYHIKLSLKGNNIRNYKLNIIVTDKVYNKYAPEENYNYKNLSILNFDSNRHVFYSVKNELFNNYIVENYRRKSGKQKLGGFYPEIILGKNNYYFINNNWYEMNEGNKLFTVIGDD